MAQQTAEKLAQRAFDLGLITERQLQEVWSSFGSHNVSEEEFLQALLRREFLTNYQVERLKRGERTGFFFGPYKVQYHVGAGTFARVFRAVHKNTGEVVALKVLRSRFSDKPDQYGLFLREGRVGCALRHPNIVQIYDVISERNCHFFVMEFIEGRSLREFVKIRKKLGVVEATRLMIDVTQGLCYAFEHGLTHRDLKMSNVLVSSRGQAKLVDFGLAAVDEALGESLGDASNSRAIDYAALERSTGVRKDDTRSDIYFLGCIYYHMVTGVPPLPETTDRLQRLSKQRFLDITPIHEIAPDLPHSVALVINRAMKFDPGQRYQTPAAMLADLNIALERLDESGRERSGETAASLSAIHRAAKPAPAAEPAKTVFVVEAHAPMQEVLRTGLKKAGYRVLLTADPSRGLARLQEDAETIDCALFSSQELGESALRAFRELDDDTRTQPLPAILLLDVPHRSWRSQVQVNDRRKVLVMPITLRQLRKTIDELIASTAQRAPRVEIAR
ncbi:MAG: protein kinase domain-containing protein [Planctomycetota bacterium]